MDYLDLPEDVFAQYPDVPFTSTLQLRDPCLFAEFPEQQGFRSNGTFLLERPIAEVMDFIQSWLFFGLISELLGEELDVSEFKASNDAGDPIIKLGRLTRRLVSLREQQDSDTPSAQSPSHEDSSPEANNGLQLKLRRRRYCLSRKHCISHARAQLDLLETELVKERNEACDRIVLSICLLIEAIGESSSAHVFPHSEYLLPGARALQKIMLGNGWCVHHWHQIATNHGYCTTLYRAMIRRTLKDATMHDKCTEKVCSAWKSPLEGLPLHVTSDCACHVLEVDRFEVAKIIMRGGIPLVSIEKEASAFRLTLHSSQFQTGWLGRAQDWFTRRPYVAISHVWSDGLGNPDSNGLPECQIRRLHSVLKMFEFRTRPSSRKRYLWLDTLCVPISKEVSSSSPMEKEEVCQSAKLQTIDRMNAIYAGASETVILDAEIRQLSSSSPRLSLLSRACHSGWSTRGWTLQEGNLSEHLYFALADGMYDPKTSIIWKTSQRGKNDDEIYTVWVACQQNPDKPKQDEKAPSTTQRIEQAVHHDWSEHNDTKIPKVYEKKIMHGAVVRQVWNALNSRHTSQSNDLGLILANLSGLSASDVARSSKPVATIFRNLQSIPLGVLYNTGARFCDERIASHASGFAGSPENRDHAESGVVRYTSDRMNCWVPISTEGIVIPDGPLLTVADTTLTLDCSSEDFLQGNTAMIVWSRTALPRRLSIKSAYYAHQPLVVHVVDGDEEVIIEPGPEDTVATGFVFIFNRSLEVLTKDNRPIMGAVLKIHELSGRELTTTFYSPVQAHAMIDRKIESSDGENPGDLHAFLADYRSTDSINILFDPDRLGPGLSKPFSSFLAGPSDSGHSRALLACSIFSNVFCLFLFGLTTGIARSEEARSKLLRLSPPLFINSVYILLVVSLNGVSYRIRYTRYLKGESTANHGSDRRRRMVQCLWQALHILLESRFLFAAICMAFGLIWTVLIAISGVEDVNVIGTTISAALACFYSAFIGVFIFRNKKETLSFLKRLLPYLE